MPKVLSPKEWGAKVDYDSWNDAFTPDDGVALHHGGSGDYPAHKPPYSEDKEMALLRSWEQHHLNKGWRGLAYGWGVGQTGTIYRIRGWSTYGAHTGDVDGDGIANNAEIIPIIFIGSGNYVALSPAAQASIEWLRREVLQKRSPKAVRLYGHQEVTSGTACPGPKLMEYVRSHRVILTSTPEELEMTPAEKNEIADLTVAKLMAHPMWAQSEGGNPIPIYKGLSRMYTATNETVAALRAGELGEGDIDVDKLADEIVAAGLGEDVAKALGERLLNG